MTERVSLILDKLRNLLPQPRVPAAWIRFRSASEVQLERVRRVTAPYWEHAAEWYDKREPREKVLLRVLGVIVLALFVYNLIYVPAIDLREGLSARIVTRREQIAEVRGMMRTYQRLRLELASTQKRTVPGGKDFSLFSVVESTLTNSVGRSKIGSITPGDRPVPGGYKQYTVDVKLNDLNLKQVVDTLFDVQHLNVPVTIANLQIREHAQNSRTYDVDLTCSALGKSG
ncbi:MAG TPA: type II secretion system protein GspM [Candidatus Binataceae bacterium]|nr:type II secretion system protein GspM [Candidatus Binataceae bacterium]